MYKKVTYRDFPSGPVVKTLCSQCREPGFNPWSTNWIPHAANKSSPNATKFLCTATKTWLRQINKCLKKKVTYGFCHCKGQPNSRTKEKLCKGTWAGKGGFLEPSVGPQGGAGCPNLMGGFQFYCNGEVVEWFWVEEYLDKCCVLRSSPFTVPKES